MIGARFAVLFFVALGAAAQYIPPIPKTVTGGRGLNRTKDIPLPSPDQQWVRARSAHFVTLSAAGERRTREVVNELETVALALQQVDARFAAPGEPARMIMMARTRDVTPYFELLVGRGKSAGAFVVNPEGGGTMLVDASRPFVDGTAYHELVHSLLANSGTRLPLWLEEGMAEFFSTAEVSHGIVRFGRTLTARTAALRNRPLMRIHELFEVKPDSEVSATAFFYAQSWAVVDWMMRADRVAFFSFVDDVDHGADAFEAARRHFRFDPEMIARSLQSGQARPIARITIHVEQAVEGVAIEPIGSDDAVIELATFLGGFEATRGDAERFLNSVATHAPAIAARAALSARDRKYEEATKLYEDALKLSPDDANIRLAFAEALLGNAIGPFSGTADIESDAAPRFRRARQLAAAALDAGADPARANAVIGTSYLIESDPSPGIGPLLRARSAQPGRYDVALTLYALMLRSGDTASADDLYKDVTALARTPQAIFAARAVFVREQLAQVNRLIAANQMDQATSVLARLIDATPDANAKMELQRQLMGLKEIGEANRQIMIYNEAIQAANRGETKKALAILDKLLETASDPSVIRDATEFRKVLRKRRRASP